MAGRGQQRQFYTRGGGGQNRGRGNNAPFARFATRGGRGNGNGNATAMDADQTMMGPDRKGRHQKGNKFNPYARGPQEKKASHTISEDNKKLIKDYVASKWNPEAKYLNLEACVEQLSNIGADFGSQQFVAEVFGIIQTNCPEVQTINFANNNITSLKYFAMLPHSATKLINLSFSQNRISDMGQLTFLRGFSDTLNELLLTGNPCIADLNTKLYQHHVKTMFPRLVLLDSTQARTVIAFDIPIGLARSEIPVGPSSLFLGDSAQRIATDFVQQYFPKYDGNRQELLGAYSPVATFSLTVGKNSQRVSEGFKNISHNLAVNPSNVLSQASAAALAKLNEKGAKLLTTPIDIVYTLGQLPKSRHNVGDFSADVFVIPSKTTTGGSDVLSVSVDGVFTEAEREVVLGFHRVFLLVPDAKDPGGWPFKILNDQLCVFDGNKAEKNNPNPAPAPAPSPVAQPPSPQQLAVATQLAQAVGVSLEMAGQVLIQTGGNLEAAQQQINVLKQQQQQQQQQQHQQQQQLLLGQVGIL